ncbi:MAG: PilZ domain-containing protein [Hydrogenophaga sp.]|nr:PilZ domain-containing protein [Hydrogenophaga sp.]
MTHERRIDHREPLHLEVLLAGGGKGVTRNVSHSGLLIDTDCQQDLGSFIDFEILFPTAGGQLGFQARGEVVRLEPAGGGAAVAVRVLATQLKPLD